MKSIFLLSLLTMLQSPFTLFEFTKNTDPRSWSVVNDGVMGGLSKGRFSISQEGHGVFEGNVSLENNGGFSLIQHQFGPIDVSAYSALILKLKGDGKKYQIRVKSVASQYYNYAFTTETSGEWQTISIPFDEMTPQFRGRELNMPQYPGDQMGEIAVLIGNKRAEDFRIMIDHIVLK